MKKETKLYLHDLLKAIAKIENFMTNNNDFNTYQSNEMLKSAVERQLLVIGEAVNRILKTEPSVPITNARRIVDFRNFVIHEYDEVEDTTVWVILVSQLPKLKEEVKSILNT